MKGFFPWRFFWKFFLNLVFLLNFSYLLSWGIASYFMGVRFESAEPLVGLAIFFVLSAIGSAVFAYRLASPLRRVILKALRIANKKQVAEFDKMEEILEEEPGEFFELEVALDKIRKKMKKRRLQLAHEREESQALMSSLEDAILTVTPELKIKFFNSRFANQFLGNKHAELLAKTESVPLAQVFREPEILRVFEKTIANAESQTKNLKLESYIDGEQRLFSIRVSPLREERTLNLYGAMALFHDITEIKRADQIRIEFVENVSHELRTPLTSVKGFLATASEDMDAGRFEQVPQFLSIITKSVDRLIELVNDMLTLSSLDSGSSVTKEMIHPDEITQEVIERIGNIAAEKGIMIHSTSEVKSFSADGRKVEQVLWNLLSNAIKYIQARGKVEIKWDEDGPFVRLRVIDNGPGIAETHLSRLFERFYRIDKGRSRDVGGTGLGLSIVKHIMISHGGSVHVKSQPGQGAEFTCFFPK